MMKLRYVELEPSRIFNWLNPKNITCWTAFPELRTIWWEPETLKIREEFGKIWTEEFDKITGHFSKLEKSMLRDGFHHPISVVSGKPRDKYLTSAKEMIHFPPELQADIHNVVYSHTFGGSRLSIAQKHNLKVPCVVHDFENLFEDCPQVTKENFTEWFPNNYMFVNATPHLRLVRHSHLTNEKYNNMNGHTRNAQNAAIRIAKDKINA